MQLVRRAVRSWTHARLVILSGWLLLATACSHSSSSAGSGEQARWPKAGYVPLAAELKYPLAMAVGGDRLWVVASNRDVVLIENGSTRVVKSFGWVHAIAADDQGAWVAANDELTGKTSALWRILPTGEATRVAEDAKYVVNAGANLLVWRDNAVVVRDASGAERPLGFPVAVDARTVGDLLYFGSREGEVYRVPLAGGTPELVGKLGNLLESFDVSGDTIFASVDDGIYTLSIHGGARQTVVEHLDDPRELVADGQGGVYVLTYGTTSDMWGHSTNDDGELLHVARGGRITALASDFIGAGRIALTKDKIYVTDVYGGRVMAIPR